MATKKSTTKSTSKSSTKSSNKNYGFSMNRALGITKLKTQIARATGIPTTKAGMQRKFERIVTKSIFSNRGIFFWLGFLLFFPITIPICLVKNHKQKKAEYMQAIEEYYLQEFSQENLQKNDKRTIRFQAEQFKQYFDAQKMPKTCKAYYIEKYNDILNFIGNIDELEDMQPDSNALEDTQVDNKSEVQE